MNHDDCERELEPGQKKRNAVAKGHVAILGYGDDGRSQAMRLKAAGVDIVVAVRPGGMSWIRAMKDGFRPKTHAEAVKGASVVAIMVPEAEQPALYSSSVAPNLSRGALLVFAHAAPIYARAVEPDASVDVVLVTCDPDTHDRRSEARSFVAVHQDTTGQACARAVAYARAAFGEAAASVATTTFAERTAMDLADEAQRSGGVTELLAAWEKRLAAAGHEPDEASLAYYERLKKVALDSSTFQPHGAATRERGVA
jgi:ketol-acid reductoisomerase